MAISRISPADLKARLEAGDTLTIVDARLRYPYEHSSLAMPNAVRVAPASADVSTVPTSHEIVVFDSDPDEVTALDVAARLAARGARVGVLTGGLNGWITAGGSTSTKLAVGQPAPAADAVARG